MPKIHQPLYGTEATGSIASAITFANQWGWAIARGYRFNQDRPTPLKTYHRGHFTAALLAWNQLTTAQKQEWQTKASPPLTALNAFVRAFILGTPPEAVPQVRAIYGLTIFGTMKYAEGA